jgi:peptide/nickel transport system substrate-binding protein
MTRKLRMLAFLGGLAVVLAACAPAEEEGGGQAAEVTRGGTLRAGLESDVDTAFNPQGEYYSVTWGFYHCCLARTLVSPEGVPAAEGGNEIQPDLATDLPEASEDGLTYTFTLKDGIQFGPPINREIVAEDFITALTRLANPVASAEGYPFYYSVIEGFDEVTEGKADEISGLRAVDDKTLEITLTRPAGDFPRRMAMPATAPIPAEAAEGHLKDYGRFLVSSGPYMFEGSEDMDFTAPPEQQEPAAGYVPGRQIILVRNPSWDPETDELRPAYVDRVEVEIGLTAVDMHNKIEAGELDLALDVTVPPTQFLQKYTTNPDLTNQVHTNEGDGINYIALNLAMPPTDDIHVRKAINLVTDKAGMIRVSGGELGWGAPAGHVMYEGLINNLLADFDPYATPDSAGDVEAAKAEMAQSVYDTDGDGVCDDPACDNVPMSVDEADPYPDQAAIWAENLEQIGINADISTFERSTFYDKCNDPGAGVPLCQSAGWYKDYADPTTFGEPLFGSSAIFPSCCNYSLVGATQQVLNKYNLDPATPIPNVDDQLAECDALPLGDERLQCFADANRTIMEEVVPWVPISEARETFIVPPTITRYKYDQFSSGPALDQIAVAGGGGAA